MSRGTDEDWRLPVVERMRDDFRRVAERDAARPKRRRVRRPGLAVAAIALLVIGVLIAVLDGGESDAVAGIRDAPRAAELRGGFAFRTQFRAEVAGRATSSLQLGEVDLRREAFAARTVVRGARAAERRAVGGTLFFRRAEGGGRWSRTTGAARPAFASPVSAAGLRALADARGEELVSRREQVAGLAVDHLRLRMPAGTFLRLQAGAAPAALRGVVGTVDVWLDRDDLPRRVRAAFTNARGDAFSVDTTYGDYGPREEIAAPRGAEPAPGAVAADDPVVTSMVAALGR